MKKIIDRIKTVDLWVAVPQMIGAMGMNVLTYYALHPTDFTSWEMVGDTWQDIISNPYVLISTLIIGVVVFTNPDKPITYVKPANDKRYNLK